MGNIAFFGQGLRTSVSAIEEIMVNDWFCYDEIVVVKDSVDYRAERLHLDTMFNVLDQENVLENIDNILILKMIFNEKSLIEVILHLQNWN